MRWKPEDFQSDPYYSRWEGEVKQIARYRKSLINPRFIRPFYNRADHPTRLVDSSPNSGHCNDILMCTSGTSDTTERSTKNGCLPIILGVSVGIPPKVMLSSKPYCCCVKAVDTGAFLATSLVIITPKNIIPITTNIRVITGLFNVGE